VTRSDSRVLKFGIVTVVTDSSIPTVELAQWGAEDRGFVDFDRIWSWPKPVQTGGPPVLPGVGATKEMPKRVMDTATAGCRWMASSPFWINSYVY
jgi:hypothetical protein